MPKEKEYVLRAGVVMHVFGTDIYRVGAVETEEAEQYLKRYPKQIVKFSKFPSDWEQRTKDIELTDFPSQTTDAPNITDEEVNALNAEIDSLRNENALIREQLEASAKEASAYQDTISELRQHIEELENAKDAVVEEPVKNTTPYRRKK